MSLDVQPKSPHLPDVLTKTIDVIEILLTISGSLHTYYACWLPIQCT